MKLRTRLRLWFASKDTAAQIADDAHKALSKSLRREAIQRHRISQLEAEKRVLRLVAACTDPVAHVSLAARAERAESALAQAQGKDAHEASA